MTGARRGELVLALHPHARGVAFALFESPLSPIDWGVKRVTGGEKNAQSLEVIKCLVERLQPDILVLEDLTSGRVRRSRRIRRLQWLIASYGEGQSIEVHWINRQDIRECFKAVGAVTRYEIAQAIASQIHAFGHRLPPVRQIWMTEDARMGLFDAASLVMTHYCQAGECVNQSGEQS